MRDIHSTPVYFRKTAWFVMLCLLVCLCAGGALADAVMPRMPAPPNVPVYWQLARIDQTPEVHPTGGYSVHYDTFGMQLNLADGLLTESQLENDDAAQGITFIVERDDQVLLEQTYIWNPLPIYLEPDTTYPITVTGTQAVGSGTTPNSLLGIYTQGDLISRISAGGYTGHADNASFEVNTDVGIYTDGSLVISFVLRDVNDMFRHRIAFTYEMSDGIKPVPTPIPGFVSTDDLPGGDVLPDYYVSVPGKTGLWRILTAPEEYRAYGFMNGIGPDFFPADRDGKVRMNETPADPQADFDNHVKGFVPATPGTVPAEYTDAGDGTYTFTTRDGETVTRAYGHIDGNEPAFYPVDEQGAVAEDAAPVSPQEDFETHVAGFGHAAPETPIAHYRVLGANLYGFTARDGSTLYRVYGRLDGAEPAYYPADETGALLPDAQQPVQPQDDFDSYIKGFDATIPEVLPKYYRTVRESLYAVDDREGNPVYRTYGIKDGMAPAFYPSDAEGTVAETAEAVQPEDDFDAYVAGFIPATPTEVSDRYEPTNTEGVWTFTDKDGNVHYRVYGSLHREEPAFYPADAQGTVAADALPVQPASDLAIMPPPPFHAAVPEIIPAHYRIVEGTDNVYEFTNMQGETVRRVYGAFGKGAPMFYPADETGEPEENTPPIDTNKEYEEFAATFNPQAADEAIKPPHYTIVDGHQGLYAIDTIKGETIYRIYGQTEAGEPAFYPADEHGNIISGEAVDPETERAQHFEGFTPQQPDTAAIPEIYAAVEGVEGLYRFTDEDYNEIYRIYGGTGSDPAFYPADKEGNLLSGKPADAQLDASTAAPRLNRTVITLAPDPTAANTPLTRVSTPAPETETYAPYERSIQGTPDPQDPDNTPIARVMDPPTETETPYNRDIKETPDPDASSDISSVDRQYTPDPDATAPYNATILDPATPESTNETISRTETTSPEPSQPTDETPTPETSETPAQTETPQTTPSPAPAEPTGLSTTWWIVIIAGAAVVLGGGGYLIWRSRKK